jgi:hypothetical protein
MTALESPATQAPARTRAASRSRAVLQSIASSRDPVSLGQVMEVAGLQTRVDHKYLLTPEQFATLVGDLGPRFRALEIGGRRLFGYESAYFDSPDLALFRAHRQGRRRRYKIRTRNYLDSRESLFEVKLEGRREETVKHRIPYPFEDRGRINRPARDFLEGVLRSEYGLQPPQLVPSVTTRYGRATLVDLGEGARLTCDVDLECALGDRSEWGPDRVLVESKSTGSGFADRALAARGVRPVSVSKYCVGIALLHPQLPANRWNRILRHEFGWRPRRACYG